MARLRSVLGAPAAAPLGVLAAGVAAALYLYGTDPHEPGHVLPGCPFRLATGLLCPACGGTRMAYDLMHGQYVMAWHDNAALLLAAPFVLALLGSWTYEGLRGRHWSPPIGGRGAAAILIGAAAWAVLRNAL
ncbi:DUF2752 domain-containing protein [Streptomyces sp. NPDC059897]|uniref:DUF2752 domain-containing protein n=1 Tax=Streptomyces sp. NPDC059897 TaxID=3346994 RepID=UPI0036508FBF